MAVGGQQDGAFGLGAARDNISEGALQGLSVVDYLAGKCEWGVRVGEDGDVAGEGR